MIYSIKYNKIDWEGAANQLHKWMEIYLWETLKIDLFLLVILAAKNHFFKVDKLFKKH